MEKSFALTMEEDEIQLFAMDTQKMHCMPSYILLSKWGRVKTYGEKARKKAKWISTKERPFVKGRIESYTAAKKLLRCLWLEEIFPCPSSRIVFPYPVEASPFEKKSYQRLVESISWGRVRPIGRPEAVLSALGTCPEEIFSPGILVLSGGYSTGGISVLSNGGILLEQRTAFSYKGLVLYLKETLEEMYAADFTKQEVINLLNTFGLEKGITPQSYLLIGQNKKQERAIKVTAQIVWAIGEKYFSQLGMLLPRILKSLPPFVLDSIANNGVVFSGKLFEIRGSDAIIKKMMGIPICHQKDPSFAVVRGGALLLTNDFLLSQL